jgi:integrase
MTDPAALVGPQPSGPLARAAAAADTAAARGALARYRAGLAAETRRAQDADLARWARYLAAVGVSDASGAWADDADCWRAVSWGLVEGFIAWQEAAGYARTSIARALCTVRRYATQAARAGALAPEALRLIATVEAPSRGKAARNRDATRTATRLGQKKAEAVPISPAQARALKRQPDTPQGRRDALLMCLLLDHGLRVSEVADLRVTDLDTARGQFTFYRRKVDKTQTHRLTPDTLRAARRYMAEDAPAAGQLLRASLHTGALTKAGLSTRRIAYRVAALAKALGVTGFSPHDCRHHWATQAARAGADPLALQEAGGWASLSMPRRYVAEAVIANQGIPLPAEAGDDEP